MKILNSSSRIPPLPIRQICLQQSRSITSAHELEIPASKEARKRPENEDNELSKPISTPSTCRPLPLSPYTVNASTTTYTPKPRRNGSPTPFQQQLAKNPYAQALATPMRQCLLTKYSLPKYFFQDIEAVLHPVTNVPNYLPRSLAVSTKARSKEWVETLNPRGSEEAQVEDDGTEEDFEDGRQKANAMIAEFAADAEKTSTSPNPISTDIPISNISAYTPNRGQTTHLLLRHSLLQCITKKPKNNQKNRFLYAYTRFPTRAPMLQHQWRPDMADWVLELRRRRIVEMLGYLISRKAYVIPCGNGERSTWDDAKMKKQVGALLWIGEIDVSASLSESVAEKKEAPPPEFATLHIGRPLQKKTKIPVHSLPALLGPSKLSQLHQSHPEIFSSKVVAIKHRQQTVVLQMQLWALQGYMARHGFEELDVDDGIGENKEGEKVLSNEDAVCWVCGEKGHKSQSCEELVCDGCGKRGYSARKCPDAACRVCGGKGHKADMCPNPPRKRDIVRAVK